MSRSADGRSAPSRADSSLPRLLTHPSVLITLAAALPHLLPPLLRGFPLRQDALRATLPWWTYTRDELSAGRLPLWDPHRLAGMPHLGNPQVGFFYPPNWLVLPMPPHVAIGVSLAAHVALGGVLTHLLARSVGVSARAAPLAGLAWVLGAWVSARTYAAHVQIIQAAAWLPLLLAAAQALALRPRARWAGLAALALGLSALAGYPAITAYGAGAAVVLFLGSLRGAAAPHRSLALGVLALGLAALLSVPSWWPSLEIAAQSTRASGLPIERTVYGALRPVDLPSVLFPFVNGSGPTRNYSVESDWYWHETQSAGGLALAALAAYGLWVRRRERGWAPLGLVALGSLVYALGTLTPVYGALQALVPPLRAFRVPARGLVVWSLVVPVLAAGGLDAAMARPRSARRALLVAFAGGALAALPVASALGSSLPAALAGLADGALMAEWRPERRALALANIAIGLAGLAVLYAALWRCTERSDLERGGRPIASSLRGAVGGPSAPTAPARRASAPLGGLALALAYAAVLAELAFVAAPAATAPSYPPASLGASFGLGNVALWRESGRRVATSNRFSLVANAGAVLRFRNATAYDPLLLGRTVRLLRANQTIGDPWGDASNEVFLDRDGGVTWDVLGIGWWLDGEPGMGALSERLRPLPRLSVVEEARSESSPAESLSAVLEPGFDPRTSVVIEGAAAPPLGHAAGGRARVRIEEERAGYVRARVEAPRGGWLVFSESYYPGWTLETDRGGAPLLPADHAIMAAPLAPGTYYVALRFTVPWLAPCLVLASLGLVGSLRLVAPRSGFRTRADGTMRQG